MTDEARSLCRRSHDLLIFHTKGQQCFCGYTGKCEVCMARALISDLAAAIEPAAAPSAALGVEE